MGTLFDLNVCYDRNLDTLAKARNAIGECAESFVESVLQATRLKVDGREKICPDLELPSGLRSEVKSVGINNRALIYKFRLKKEALHFPDRNYLYIFVKHTCPITVKRGKDITAHLLSSPPSLVIATLADIEDVTGKMTPRVFVQDKQRAEQLYKERPCGWNREGYIEGGWQFSLKLIPSVQVGNLLGKYLGTNVITPISFTPNAEALLGGSLPVC